MHTSRQSVLSTTLVTGVAVATLFAAPVFAGPVAVTFPDAAALGDGPTSPVLPGGFSPRTGGNRGVVPSDRISIGLTKRDAFGNSAAINSQGTPLVTRGGTFTNIGTNTNGTGQVQASWDEVGSSSRTFVNVVVKTSNGEQFMPVTSRVGANPAFFWSWSMGVADPVNYESYVTSVQLVSAYIWFSADGGQSFFSRTNITSTLPQSFLPGRDPGQLLTSIGDGTNYILLQYETNVTIPAPVTLTPLAGAGLALLGRRRRS